MTARQLKKIIDALPAEHLDAEIKVSTSWSYRQPGLLSATIVGHTTDTDMKERDGVFFRLYCESAG